MGWDSKSRKQIIESDEESIQDESVTRCICGEQHSIGLMVQCDQCEVWQHCECMRLEEENIPEQYFCEQCRLTDHLESYKPLSPESDMEKKHIVEMSNNTDSDVSTAQEIDYESGRLDCTSRTTTKRIDKKPQQKRKQKRINKTPPSRTTTPQPESTNQNNAFCREKSPSIKVRLPDARMTFEEMRERANQILESIYSMQLEMRSRKTAFEEERSAGTRYLTSHLIPGSPSSMSSASTIPLNEEDLLINPVKRAEPSSFELMDLLTRDLINFKQRFG
ncbi:hypothetical protein K501DRAFT_285196 [Backusella circina FSU 941]|nr:hypothetical protein K501DRAFT_285196 [Backusella circina FSU 941]